MADGRRYIDFDAAWAERQAEPFSVRVLGRDHELPPSMPAGLKLRLARLRAEGRQVADLSWDEIEMMARYLFGAEAVDDWLLQRITDRQLAEVVLQVAATYNRSEPRPTGEANRGEAPALDSGA